MIAVVFTLAILATAHILQACGLTKSTHAASTVAIAIRKPSYIAIVPSVEESSIQLQGPALKCSYISP